MDRFQTFLAYLCSVIMETANTTVNVFIEATPNPATMKFITTKLLVHGSVDFPTKESAENSPLAKELYNFSFVKGVFVAANFVTITKPEEMEWIEIQTILREAVKGLVENGTKVTLEEENTGPVVFEGTEVEKKIQQVLHDYVKPAVESDGGAIAFKSFKEGTVAVELRGACSGCPSSTITLKAGIENLLKRMVPEVTEVVSEAL